MKFSRVLMFALLLPLALSCAARAQIVRPTTQTLASAGAYSAGTTYAIGNVVSSSGSSYVSLIVNNHGNTPASSPSDWASFGGGGASALALIPAEIYGANGNSTGVTGNGFDNTTALTSCISALSGTYIGCLLQAETYRTTGTLTLSGNSTGIVGTSAGQASPVAPSGYAGPTSTIMIDSPTATGLQVNGVWNVLQSFNVIRPVLPTGSAAGIAFGPLAGGEIANRLNVSDNIYGFYFPQGGSSADGIGMFANLQAINGQNPHVTGYGSTRTYGFYLGSDLTHSFASILFSNIGVSDVTADGNEIGFELIGAQSNDVDVIGYGIASNGLYGIDVNCTSLTGCYDDHFSQLTIQGTGTSSGCIHVSEQATAFSTSQLEFDHGWCGVTGATFDVENSQAVTFDDFQVYGAGLGVPGPPSTVVNSNRIAFRHINFTGSPQVNITGTTASIFSENMGQGSNPMSPCLFCFIGSSNNAVNGNVGYAPTGHGLASVASFDSASNSNAACGNNIAGPGTIGSILSDAGSGNGCQSVAPPTSPLEAWLSQDGTLPLQNTGTDSTNTATGSGVTFASSSGFTNPVATYSGSGGATAASDALTNFDGTHGFTVSAWINPTAVTGVQEVVADTDATTFTGWQLQLNGYQVQFGVIANAGTSNGAYAQTIGATRITAGALNHVCGQYDGSGTVAGVKIYINGVLQTSGVLMSTLSGSAASGNPVSLGFQGSGGSNFTGAMGNVEVFTSLVSCPALYGKGPNVVY